MNPDGSMGKIDCTPASACSGQLGTSTIQVESLCDLCHERLAQRILILPPYTIVKCLRCGFIYVIPRPKLSDLEPIYEESYFTGQGPHGYKPDENYLYDDTRLGIFIERIATIERYRKPPGLMLDVGCASGFSLRAARDRGWECIGIDISEFAVNIAREHHGLNVIRGTLREATLGDASVDVLTMWDLIEHVPSPREECMEASRVLKAGGVLAIATPDADAPNPSPETCDPAKAAFWQANPPEHIQYFSAHTISRLLAETGFHVVNLISFGKDDRRAGAMEVYAIKGI